MIWLFLIHCVILLYFLMHVFQLVLGETYHLNKSKNQIKLYIHVCYVREIKNWLILPFLMFTIFFLQYNR